MNWMLWLKFSQVRILTATISPVQTLPISSYEYQCTEAHWARSEWGSFCKRVRKWLKNICVWILVSLPFIVLLQSRNSFWQSPRSLRFENNPLLYTAKGHMFPTKELAAFQIKRNFTSRLQLQSSFSFSAPWLSSVWTQSKVCLLKLRLRDCDTHLLPITKKANNKCLMSSCCWNQFTCGARWFASVVSEALWDIFHLIFNGSFSRFSFQRDEIELLCLL